MKVLVLCSYNSGQIAPFVSEQVEAIRKAGVEIKYYLIKGNGIKGYLKNLPGLIRQIDDFSPDLIHAHYGLSGLLANLQRKIPVITTFHGSDINYSRVRLLSKIAMRSSASSIFVSPQLAGLAGASEKFSIIPCGIDLNIFYPVDKSEARQKLGFAQDDHLVLFSGSFHLKVKNYPLAFAAINLINPINQNNPFLSPVKLIELKGYSHEEVNLLLNACDMVLLTSITEGSPNIIKEALACNRPVVSNDVGDIRDLIGPVRGCFIANSDPADIAGKILKALEFENSENGRQRIIDLGLEINETAGKIVRVYEDVLNG